VLDLRYVRGIRAAVTLWEFVRLAADGRATCCVCGQDLSVEAFAPARSKASGRKSICRRCDAEKARLYFERNRERVIARVTARRTVEPEPSGHMVDRE
jgi:hypothetical protein